MTRTPRRRDRAFTLLELLVSIGLIALLVVAMATFLADALRVRARVGTSIERAVSADAALSEIERALETCVVDDPILGVGVRGSSDSIEVLRAGMSAWRLGVGDAERAFEPIELLRVSFDAAAKRVTLARGDDQPVTLPGEIGRARFRYHDGERWSDSFDSVAAGRLPVAVEVAVWFVQPDAGAPEIPDAGEAAPERDRGLDRAVEAGEDEAVVDPPDRRRVIAVPDAAADPDASGTAAGGGR